MKLLGVLVAAVVLGAAGCASGEGYVKPGFDFDQIRRVAVVDINVGGGASQAERDEIADYFTFEFFKRGYDVVARREIDAALDEQKFQRTGVTTDEGAAEAGKIWNADGVIVVNMSRHGETIQITAKMIAVGNGELVWMGKGSASTATTLSTVGGAVAGGAIGVAMGGNRAGRVVGGVAGAALGGTAGYALSPGMMGEVMKAIEKTCASLPRRA